jgi:SAM-dependent methyltransferase
LKERGSADSSIQNESLENIETVDVILKGGLNESVRPFLNSLNINQLDYIISSHNFEHLPDPLAFLVDCESLLKPGGVLNMAIPIASRCFDAMRELTTCGSIIDAYNQKKKSPSIGDIIDQRTNSVYIKDKDKQLVVLPENIHINDLELRTNPLNIPSDNYTTKLKERFGEEYIDTHISTFNPFSFELIFNDLSAFGYIKQMQIENIVHENSSQEFIVNIKKLHHKRTKFHGQKYRLYLKKKSFEQRAADLYLLNSKSNDDLINKALTIQERPASEIKPKEVECAIKTSGMSSKNMISFAKKLLRPIKRLLLNDKRHD